MVLHLRLILKGSDAKGTLVKISRSSSREGEFSGRREGSVLRYCCLSEALVRRSRRLCCLKHALMLASKQMRGRLVAEICGMSVEDLRDNRSLQDSLPE